MDSVNFGLHICRDTVWTEAYLQEYSVNWGLHAGTECESTLTCRHTVWTEAYIYAETQCELRLTCKNIVWTEAYLQTHSVNWGLHAGTECESRLTCRNIVWTKAYMQAHSVNQPLLADTQCELRLTCRHTVWINPYLQTHSVNWGLHAGTECESTLTCRQNFQCFQLTQMKLAHCVSSLNYQHVLKIRSHLFLLTPPLLIPLARSQQVCTSTFTYLVPLSTDATVKDEARQ